MRVMWEEHGAEEREEHWSWVVGPTSSAHGEGIAWRAAAYARKPSRLEGVQDRRQARGRRQEWARDRPR